MRNGVDRNALPGKVLPLSEGSVREQFLTVSKNQLKHLG